MQLNISEEDIKNIIHAVKNCPTIEAHKREEILNPIREQLENHRAVETVLPHNDKSYISEWK